MPAPPGNPYEYWQIGAGANFVDGQDTGNWTGQILGLVMNRSGTCTFNIATQLIHQNTGWFETGSVINLTQPWAIFGMFNTVSAGFPQNFWSTSNFSTQLAPGNNTVSVTSDNVNFMSASVSNSNGVLYTCLWVLNGANSKFFLNGTQVTLTGGTTTGTNGMSNNTLEINGSAGGSGAVEMYIGSAVLYDNDPSAFAPNIDSWGRQQSVLASGPSIMPQALFRRPPSRRRYFLMPAMEIL